jgi:hypothetical protein
MTDLHDLLRDEGERWRAEQPSPAAVDWAAVTGGQSWRSRRALVALSAAAAVALAVVVPWRIAADRHQVAPPPPVGSISPTPEQTTNVPAGGPRFFLALRGGDIYQVDARTGEPTGMSLGVPHRRLTALGVVDGTTGFAAYSAPDCHVRVLRYHWRSTHYSAATDAVSFSGGRVDEIAVSPVGSHLAMSVGVCGSTSAYELVVANLADGTVRRWHGYGGGDEVSYVTRLHWSPDSTTVSSVAVPCCGGGYDGTRLVDTTAPGDSYISQAVVVPEYAPKLGVYSPLVWWHGRLAVLVDGDLRAVGISSPTGVGASRHVGRVGEVLATGFPRDVSRVSIAPDDRVLVQSGDSTYRWDHGVLSPVAGRWTQPGW